MKLSRISVFGTPHIGVYLFANDSIALVPPGLDDHVKNEIVETLGVEIIETKIAGSILDGVLVVGNNNGIVLPRNIHDPEFEHIVKQLSKHSLNIYVSRSRNTALGNLLLVNDRAGIVGPDFEQEEIPRIRDALDIEIFVKEIMYLTIPGSLAVVNNSGGVIHPDVPDNDLEEVRKILGVFIERATVNSGIPFIKSGLIANNKGLLIGDRTTGPEILRITRGFGAGLEGS